LPEANLPEELKISSAVARNEDFSHHDHYNNNNNFAANCKEFDNYANGLISATEIATCFLRDGNETLNVILTSSYAFSEAP